MNRRAPKRARCRRARSPLAALGVAGVSLLLALCAAASARAWTERRAGDVLASAIPLATLGTELWRGDREGAWQYGLAFVATTAGAEALKHAVHSERPDGSNDLSFPSGHAARAFSAAAYVRQRHGVEAALPLYAAALYVGHTRVAAHRHRWADVAGAALLAEASAAWLVERRIGPNAALSAEIGPHHASARFVARW
ncbi:MAG: phosphatase PAP2 family protein [Burkholderiaceae bacterium]